MQITLNNIAEILNEKDNFYILTHKSPDGDTLGSAFALCLALQKLNKNAKVLCNDDIPEKYDLLYKNVKKQDFKSDYIISVDVADTQLLGEKLSFYADKIDLCIDHHSSNKNFSKYWYVQGNSAANAEIIYEIIKLLGVEFDENIATCIYTGISTDTGCFRHTNTTSRSYRIAADMIDFGADAFKINKVMFDTKSKTRLYIEKTAIDSMEFFYGDKCSVISITNNQIQSSGALDSDFDGLSSIPRQIKGVLVGILIKEKELGTFKISVRTDDSIDASKICAAFGGGGHRCAAGCTILGNLTDVKNKILSVVSRSIGE